MSTRDIFCCLSISLFLSACMAQSAIILPAQPARAKAEDDYRQCVAKATEYLMTTRRSADSVVRDSMERCSGLRYSMLNAYPKNWRDSYAQHLDAKIYQDQLSLIYQQQQTSAVK